jgi:hypothetical protein
LIVQFTLLICSDFNPTPVRFSFSSQAFLWEGCEFEKTSVKHL